MRIVWYSFHGRYSDNPRALYEALRDRPGIEHVWLADHDHLSTFPLDASLVDVDSSLATEALQGADLVVANTHVEVPWTKPCGATYLQTWHGTPLKRIHHDVLWAPPGRLARLDEDVAKWDLLLSPNETSTHRLRQAFAYDGEVLESGYPRNDLLLDPRVDDVRQQVRARYGIAPQSCVVLYAPTWRDAEVFDEGGAVIPMALDAEDLVSGLEGHEVLVRVHNMVTGRSRLRRAPGVHDASYDGDVRELYAAADVLVTDYSSCMFDFAITGRPIVFYAYDLEDYGQSLRGFYGDFLSEAPGPVVQTEEELVEVLQSLPVRWPAYADRYAAFRERYTSLEDGHATERVLTRLGLGWAGLDVRRVLPGVPVRHDDHTERAGTRPRA